MWQWLYVSYQLPVSMYRLVPSCECERVIVAMSVINYLSQCMVPVS